MKNKLITLLIISAITIVFSFIGIEDEEEWTTFYPTDDTPMFRYTLDTMPNTSTLSYWIRIVRQPIK